MTRQEIFEGIEKKNTRLFASIFWNEEFKEHNCKVVYDQNWGDGNEWIVAIHFIDHNLDVRLEGYYSSYGDSDFTKVDLAVPYEHTETRYRPVKLADIRDIKINEITKDEN